MRALVLLLAFLTVTPPVAWGQTFETLFSDNLGRNPSARVVRGSDGNFYGTTQYGGPSGRGTIFKVSPSGDLTTLVCFIGANGSYPGSGLVEGSDGNFYGTALSGGAGGLGSIFKMTPHGALTILVSFNGANGSVPRAELVKGSDGNFYGTTEGGGSGNGTIFKMTPAGVLTTLVAFNGATGRFPFAELVEGSDGNFYGTASSGGPGGHGTAFKMTPAGDLTTLVAFSWTNGSLPVAGLVEGSDGNFYGTTESGGAGSLGTVFKVTPSGEHTTLVSFDYRNGSQPRGGLLVGGDGNLYGTTYEGGSGHGTVYRITPSGELATLVSFNSNNGSKPAAGLVPGSDGNFYGTTYEGGAGNLGTIFKVSPVGALSTVVPFKHTAGNTPFAGVVEGRDGNFYGTTYEGGASNVGTIFKVTPAGVHTTLVSFNVANGSKPTAGLVLGSDGNFYGTTSEGGTSNLGTVFKVTPDGVLVTLVSFDGTNGRNPIAELVEGSDGNFYGTTSQGGVRGYGTVFKMTPAGALTILSSFENFGTLNYHASNPASKLVEGSDGNFYGTTAGGIYPYPGSGQATYYGTIFKVTPAGALSQLAIFYGSNGASPNAEMLKASDGNLYGTTSQGGAGGSGTVFKVTPSGVFTTLTSFNRGNSTSSVSGLVEGSDGNFYGTTSERGESGYGTVFKVTPSGEFTTLYSFDGLSAAFPKGTPTFGSDGKLYGTAWQMAIWSLSVPLPPAFTSTPTGVVTSNGATLSGTVNAYGSDTTVTFEYGLTPAYGSSIAAVPGTITGSNATAVSATLSGLAPHTTYYYQFTASNSEGSTRTAGASFTTANSLPAAGNDSFHADRMNSSGTITLPVLDNDSDADGDTLTITAVTQGTSGTVAISGNSLIYTPGPSFVGRDSFSYTISDGIATASAQLNIRATDLITRALLSQDSEVPGAGQKGSEIPAGSLFKSFGVPSINSSGALVLTGSYAVPGSASELSVLIVEPRVAWTKLAARKGQTAPGTRDARFASFKDPLLNEAGDVAFLASLSGGDAKKGQRNGIWINTASTAGSQGTQLLARTGAQPPGAPEGARWQSFTSVAFSSGSNEASEVASGWCLAFTGFMTIGPGGVKSSDDMGLWIASSGKTVLALREGQKLQFGTSEKKVRTFAALKPLSNALGQGNGINGSGGVAVQVFFTDGSQGMLQLKWSGVDDLPNVVPVLAYSGAAVADLSEAAKKLGIPTQSGSGGRTAWAGSLTGKVDAAGIFERNLNESELHLMARCGDTNTGIDGASFSAFTSVAVNDSGNALLHGKVLGSGITKTNDEGLWWKKWTGEGFILQLLAREGAQSPDVPEGATWRSFTSLALPDGQQYGPLFTARLVAGTRSKPAPRSITGDNDQGLWAVDSSGELRLIVREGRQIPVEGSASAKSIKNFTVLSAVPGSPAQRRSFADDGQIVYRALFTDGSQAVMKVQLP